MKRLLVYDRKVVNTIINSLMIIIKTTNKTLNKYTLSRFYRRSKSLLPISKNYLDVLKRFTFKKTSDNKMNLNNKSNINIIQNDLFVPTFVPRFKLKIFNDDDAHALI